MSIWYKGLPPKGLVTLLIAVILIYPIVPVQPAKAGELLQWPMESSVSSESTTDSITVTWGLAQLFDPTVTYELVVDGERQMVNQDAGTVTGSVYNAYTVIGSSSLDSYSATITGLEPSRPYMISVRANYIDTNYSESEATVVYTQVPDIVDPSLELRVKETIIENLGLQLSPAEYVIQPEDVQDVTILFAEDLGISSLEGIQGLPNLSELYLGGNALTNEDLQPLSGLNNLQVLDLSENQLTSFANLDGLTAVWDLDVSYNQITNVTGVSLLYGLSYIDVSFNQISNLSEMSQLTNLYELVARGNAVSSLTFLENMTWLSYVDLAMNEVGDVSSLHTLAGQLDVQLEQGVYIDLGYNPLDFNSNSGTIQSLNELSQTNVWVNAGYFYADPWSGPGVRLYWPEVYSDYHDLMVDHYRVWVDDAYYNVPGDFWNYPEYNDEYDPTYLVTDLEPGQTYSFKVQAVLDTGEIYDVSLPLQAAMMPMYEVHIPDANLRAAIYTTLGIDPSLPLSNYDMMELTALSASGAGIVSLEGLQFATNLEHLYLSNNLIYDITPLYDLRLRGVSLGNNRISMLLDPESIYMFEYEGIIESSFGIYDNYLSAAETAIFDNIIPMGWYPDYGTQALPAPWMDGDVISASEVAASSVRLSWPEVTGASGYVIYNNQSAETVTTADTSYLMTGLHAGSKYVFKVEAIVDGVESITGPFTHVYTAHAAEFGIYTDKSMLGGGEEVEVTVNLMNLYHAYQANLTIHYDETKLEYVHDTAVLHADFAPGAIGLVDSTVPGVIQIGPITTTVSGGITPIVGGAGLVTLKLRSLSGEVGSAEISVAGGDVSTYMDEAVTFSSGPVSTTVELVEGSAATSIEVTPAAVKLDLADRRTIQLEAVVQPVGSMLPSLQWSSSDPSVAAVDSEGVVTAVAPGEAVITVKDTVSGLEATSHVAVGTIISLQWDADSWSGAMLKGIPVIAEPVNPESSSPTYLVYTDEQGEALFPSLDLETYVIKIQEVSMYEEGAPLVLLTSPYTVELTANQKSDSGVIAVLPLKAQGADPAQPYSVVDTLSMLSDWARLGRDFNLDGVLDASDLKHLLTLIPALVE